MTVLKTLAPRYWLGYCPAHILTVIAGTIRHHRSILEPTGNEDLYTLAATFGVSAGVALTWAITTEAVGYVVLLIPRRIREIKEEGRAEAMREGRAEGRAEGRQEGRQEGRAEERQEGLERVARLRARYERGEITLDEFFERVSNGYCDVCCR